MPDPRPARVPLAVTMAALALAFARPAPAQEDLARVKVKLPYAASLGVAGDAVEGLRLRLTNLETGRARAVVTGADGAFEFPDLSPGPYRLHVDRRGRAPRETITIAVPRGFLPDAEARGKPKEIVVVGLAEPRPPGAREIPVHTPEWTDLSDHDPGVAEGRGHADWIELSSLAVTGDDKTLLVTIPPEAWEAASAGRYFDLYVGFDRSAASGPAALRGPLKCFGCDPVPVRSMRGGVVFGDGTRGARPPRAKVAAPVLRERPEEP